LGVRAVTDNNIVEFLPIKIIEDTEDGVWVTGIPNLTQIIVRGQGFVENGQEVIKVPLDIT
jgi:multidrug efflux system membrane fusion protein